MWPFEFIKYLQIQYGRYSVPYRITDDALQTTHYRRHILYTMGMKLSGEGVGENYIQNIESKMVWKVIHILKCLQNTFYIPVDAFNSCLTGF